MLPRHSSFPGGRPHHRTGRQALAGQLAPLILGLAIGWIIRSLLTAPNPVPASASEFDKTGDLGALEGLHSQSTSGNEQRKQLLAFVGVQTGFTTDQRAKYNYEARQQALRATWVPGNRQELDRLEEEQAIAVRFVIGHSADAAQEAAVAAEQAAHRDILRLNLTEGYTSLPTKTIMFLWAITARYDPQYIIKVDDDVYLRLDRLPHAVAQWQDINADYIGCMKTGQIIKSPRYRWFEPQHTLLGGASYFTHAWGSVYVLSGRVARDLGAMRNGSLRQFANEDVTIGSWLLAFNATHYDDRRLCETNCSASSIAVYDMPVCTGLCNAAAQLPQLHASEACHLPATDPTGVLPLAPPIFNFERRSDPAWDAEAVRQLRAKRERVAQGIKPRFPEYDTTQPLR